MVQCLIPAGYLLCTCAGWRLESFHADQSGSAYYDICTAAPLLGNPFETSGCIGEGLPVELGSLQHDFASQPPPRATECGEGVLASEVLIPAQTVCQPYAFMEPAFPSWLSYQYAEANI